MPWTGPGPGDALQPTTTKIGRKCVSNQIGQTKMVGWTPKNWDPGPKKGGGGSRGVTPRRLWGWVSKRARVPVQRKIINKVPKKLCGVVEPKGAAVIEILFS